MAQYGLLSRRRGKRRTRRGGGVAAREEDDARRSGRRGAESGVDLRQRGCERLQLRGDGTRALFVRAADEDEVLRSREQPLLVGGREGDGSVRLTRRAIAFDAFED